jgi:hypothetical protein
MVMGEEKKNAKNSRASVLGFPRSFLHFPRFLRYACAAKHGFVLRTGYISITDPHEFVKRCREWVP